MHTASEPLDRDPRPPNVPEPTNRRGFLRAFVRSAGEALVEATGVVKTEFDEPVEPDAARARAAEARPPCRRR